MREVLARRKLVAQMVVQCKIYVLNVAVIYNVDAVLPSPILQEKSDKMISAWMLC